MPDDDWGVGMADGKRTRSDRMARHMAALVRGRPWLGWRHRRSMEAYTALRRRNALLQVGLNGGMCVYNIAVGRLLFVPLMVAVSVDMARTWRKLGSDPSRHQRDWQEVRDALAEGEAERAAGRYRRLPSARAVAVLAAVGLVFPLQAKIGMDLPWSTLIAAGVVFAIVLVVGDVYLHLRNVPETIVDGWDGVFPIADYDRLTVAQIVPLLPKLYYDELPLVAARERAGKARRTILDRLERLETVLADAPGDVTAEQWRTRRRSPAPALAA